MPRYLLDFPSLLNIHHSNCINILRDFNWFVAEYKPRNVDIVPCVDNYYSSMLTAALVRQLGRNSLSTSITRVLYRLSCDLDPGELATPRHMFNPPHLDSWKRALRNEILTSQNWREPQILYSECRRDAWPTAYEIEIEYTDCTDTTTRIIASIANYKFHPLLDPWESMEPLHRVSSNRLADYPCRLPRPPNLHSVLLEHLADRLALARQLGWEIDGKFYFVPPDDFDPTNLSEKDWKEGKVFKKSLDDDGMKGGPSLIDYNGRKWRWDTGERHWDVFEKDDEKHYVTISHDGTKLRSN